MCGISGYFGKTKINLNKKEIINSLKHRGPDNQSIFEKYEKNNLFLAFSRLSIIDLNPRSNQPFAYKNFIICFNGEIYNFKEIRENLKKKGINFRTNSDTEVLIKFIYHEGIEKINKLEGMWAFVLYDTKKDKLIFCKDRFGEKPLFFLKKNKNIYFASEISQIKKLIPFKLDIDQDYLKKYLFTNYRNLNKSNHTIYKNLHKVERGHYIVINKSLSIVKKRYFKFQQKIKTQSYKNIKTNIKKILISYSKKTLNSDVPVAFCLSGGVDSSSLAAIAKKELKKNIHCFTLDPGEKSYDEKKAVNSSIKKLKLKHTWVKINKNETFENLRKILSHRSSPLSTLTNYIQWLLYKNISKKGYKVAISGIGADEIFSGYYDHHLAYFYDIRKNKPLFRESLLNWKKNILPLIRNKFFRDHLFYFKFKSPHYLFDKNKDINRFSKIKLNFKFKEKKFIKSKLRNRMLNELLLESVPVVLEEEDLNAMYFSVENRSPFLNHKLFEYLNTVDTKYFIKNGYAKSLLRDSLKLILPGHVRKNYEKIGFNVSLPKLINFKSKNVLNFINKDSKIYKYVKKDLINKIIRENDIQNNSYFLFKFLNIKLMIDQN
jgi:asparagine synthase (glutamine-hydrolysing)|tara:strand:+ start:75 stop:1883 length:1809 start_codon:yes stop_codon:yes gene_type:complete